MPIEPTQEQLAEIGALAGGEGDGPVVMLNLNRYRKRAHYGAEPPDGAGGEVSGHEAYGRYGEVAQRVLARVGGSILWYSQAQETVIGDENDRYDEVIAVRYPSRAAFLELVTAPEILAALAHRSAGLERAAIICCEPGLMPGAEGD